MKISIKQLAWGLAMGITLASTGNAKAVMTTVPEAGAVISKVATRHAALMVTDRALMAFAAILSGDLDAMNEVDFLTEYRDGILVEPLFGYQYTPQRRLSATLGVVLYFYDEAILAEDASLAATTENPTAEERYQWIDTTKQRLQALQHAAEAKLEKATHHRETLTDTIAEISAVSKWLSDAAEPHSPLIPRIMRAELTEVAKAMLLQAHGTQPSSPTQ